MKKWVPIVLALAAVISLTALIFFRSNRTVKGSEQTVRGVVLDRAMATMREEDAQARSYMTLRLPDGTTAQFWFSRPLQRQDARLARRDGRGVCGAGLGDTVTLQTATEAATGLRVITAVLDE